MALENLKTHAGRIGKPLWRPMLAYVADLHAACVRPACEPFPYDWEEIGTGYCYGPAFGHWDIIHSVLDTLPWEPEHARRQILNDLAAQEPDGLVPGSIWMRDDRLEWSTNVGHPPVWPVAVDDYVEQTGNRELLRTCFGPLVRQIGWFETHRKADPEGYYYLDILTNDWESGVDEGVRFDDIQQGAFACVDATSHVYTLYDCAARWAEEIGENARELSAQRDRIRQFIQQKLFCEETGFFHDVWSVNDPAVRRMTFEGMWPVVVGAATEEQARRVIDENLLDEETFLTRHPLATVSVSDPAFEKRLWRGPAWNSMTLWAARGCLRHGRKDAARALLERALDASAEQFDGTGTVWEFYDSLGGNPEDVKRKPHTPYNAPCRDYLGHNPLMTMARMWEEAV